MIFRKDPKLFYRVRSAIAGVTVALVVAGVATAHAQDGRGGDRTETDPRRTAPPASETARDGDVVNALRDADVIPRGLDRPINPDTYVLGPSDQIVLVVRGTEQREIALTVLPEGTVILPNVGPRYIAGLTLTELRQIVRDEVQKYYKDVQMYVQLIVPRRFVVYVLGEVEAPGPVELGAPFRMDAAIRAAGGVTVRGSRRMIEIRSDDGSVATADMDGFLRRGELNDNPILSEGQTVFVPTRAQQCGVVGEVWRGGTMEVLPGETIADMIALAGGFTSYAVTDRIVLERIENERLSVTPIAPDALTSTTVQDRDLIVVPDVRTFPGSESVRVQGGRGREGRVLLAGGETLADFVPRFVRLQDDHDLANAVVERTAENGSVQFIPVDLRDVIDGTGGHDIVLQNGDVISVPVIDDNVYVSGAVTQPGPIPFQRGLPAARYIAMAGGMSSEGSIDRLEIFDTEGNRRGGDRDSRVYRGETILVKRRKAVIFGSLFIAFTSMASLILATIAVSK